MTFCLMFMFFSGLVVFCLLHKHLIVMLFSLEYLIVVLFLMFYMFLLMFGFEMYYLLIFLVFSVCEGALGLGMLVNMIRSHGNDLLSGSLILW
uniref:NADH dehydrogenase subunit 4L n=1 Tax=Iphicrates gressitti TaxID=2969360 RepID=UPI002176C88D|nr:NADH dehydrogenase subunit 4L [Iphicrates gressitti]UUJ37773.1 NADH dehydrogenase subunit 4L [Iphicrates gressitti]